MSAQGGEGEDASESVAVLAAASGDASWLAAALEAAGLSDELAGEPRWPLASGLHPLGQLH